MEHLLSMLTMSDQEIIDVLDLADKIKAEVKQGVFKPYLKNKTIGLIFQKASTRTRVSFEVWSSAIGCLSSTLRCKYDAKLAVGNQFKILPEFFRVIWMVL